MIIIDVITPTYERTKSLLSTLASLQMQTYPKCWEAYVIDDYFSKDIHAK
jgi:glycosyltransferase involved in cell wall biosynthesis